MHNAARDQQMRRLARAARTAGHAGTARERTHYLSAAELRGVPAARLIRETAWAERPSASPQWREQRRDVVAEEFARRGFTDTAATVREHWSEPDYSAVRVAEAERRAEVAEAGRDEARRDQAREHAAGTGPDASEAAVVAGSVAALIAVGETVHADDLDTVLAAQEQQLGGAWAGADDEPGMAGDTAIVEGSIEADTLDSLSASPVSEVAAGPDQEPAIATPEPETTPE